MKDSWQVESTQYEQLTIVGPYDEGQECLRWLFANGYTPTRTGPYTDREMHPKVDVERFLFVAEREMPSLRDEVPLQNHERAEG